jgi:hypothetical protein
VQQNDSGYFNDICKGKGEERNKSYKSGIYIYSGYILSIRSDVVMAAQTPPLRTEKKSKKTENLIKSRFYGSISLIA